jgi:hypothetical protein
MGATVGYGSAPRVGSKTSVADPDPYVFGSPGSGSVSMRYRYRYTDPDWIRILLSSSKNSKKNLDSYCFVTSFDFLSLKHYVNLPSKSNKQKNFLNKLVFC